MSEDEKRKHKFRATAFIVGVAGISALIGFSRTLAIAKKNDTQYFDKGISANSIEMTETGAQLGIEVFLLTSLAVHINSLRALKWGTLIAIIGTGSLCFGVYKLSGANDLKEFRIICGNILPRIPKNKEHSQSRTDFENLSDLMSYVSQWKKNN
ncbi:transmembrane protein 242 isoform X1 [Chironomus tepperi]|uniref:transmembrane protein 242 isoform X1 n=1 Tax=Chironomus tepperi TaxID=113505 RepID=UPI00391F8303